MIDIAKIPPFVWTILSVGLLFIVLYILKTIIDRGFHFKDFKLKGASKGDCPESHADCPRHNDIMIVIDKSLEVSNYEITTMKIETIREQMDFADHTMTNLLNNLQKYYITELSKYLPEEELTRSDDFLSYSTVLELFKGRLMNSFREFCRQNHLAEMNDIEFEKYRNMKTRSLLNEGSKYLNELYLHQKNITREKLYDLNEPHIGEFLSTISGIIDNARLVAIKNKKNLISKKTELALLLESFVGINNPILDVWKKQHGLI